MYDGLRVDEYFYLLGRHTEEPARLDDLETLVHQRRRIDGDLRSHVPGGMAQRVCRSDMAQLLVGELAERTTRTGEQQFADLVVALADQALEDGRMFGIDGQDGHTIRLGKLADQLARHDQGLLVGQADRLSGPDGANRRGETTESHHAVSTIVIGPASTIWHTASRPA